VPVAPEEPGEADHVVLPLDELELEELLLELDDDDELVEEPEVVEPVESAAVVATERAAIVPASPRNVAGLSSAATTRDRFAACRRRRRRVGGSATDAGGPDRGEPGNWLVLPMSGRGAGGAPPSHRNPDVSRMSSPRVPSTRRPWTAAVRPGFQQAGRAL
jgi:hypothetical protein